MSSKLVDEVRNLFPDDNIDELLDEIELLSQSFKGKTVDEWLDAVDYTGNDDYQPTKFALKFVNFMKLVDGTETERNETPVVHMKVLDSFITDKDRVANLMHRGIGKALALSTPIPTPTGWTTMKDIRVGDQVIGSTGHVCNVVYKSPIHNKPMYRISLADGRELLVCEDHNNIVLRKKQKTIDGKRTWITDREVITTKDLLNLPLYTTRSKTNKNPKGKENRLWFPLTEPVEYSTKKLPLDPYTLGLLLGDGIFSSTDYCRLHGHKDDLPLLLSYVPYEQESTYVDKRNSNVLTVGLLGLGKTIKEMGIVKTCSNKFIPDDYLRSSVSQRLELLQGLMDTNGTIGKHTGTAEFSSNSKHLALGVQELVLSLGGMATIRYKTERNYTVSVRLNMPLFKLPRKLERQTYGVADKVAVVSITRIEDQPSQCIMVDSPDHSFLASDYVVTHNTTLIEYLFPYLAFYEELPGMGKINLAMYVSDSMDNGVASMKKNLEHRWENSEFLQKVLPKRNAEGKEVTKFTESRWQLTNTNGFTLVVKGFGAQTGIRGVKEMGKRPQLAVLDDLVSDEDARSPTALRKIKDTVYRAIEHALDPEGKKIIWCGTPFNAKDPLYEAVESGSWEVNVYPICEYFPCPRSEFNGSWEDRFTYTFVLKEYLKALNDGELASFNQELMLRIMSEEDRLVAESEIQWYERKELLRNRSYFNYYITTDFAVTDKESADFSFISVWAVNPIGDFFWVDGICARQDMGRNVDDLFGLARKWQENLMSVGIEVSGQQGGFIPWLRREMTQRNFWFTLASSNGANSSNQVGIKSTKNKLERFNVVVPEFKKLKFYFPSDVQGNTALLELISELRLACVSGFKSKHDDAIDTVSMLGMMRITPPSGDVSEKATRNPIWGGSASSTPSGLSSYIV